MSANTEKLASLLLSMTYREFDHFVCDLAKIADDTMEGADPIREMGSIIKLILLDWAETNNAEGA